MDRCIILSHVMGYHLGKIRIIHQIHIEIKKKYLTIFKIYNTNEKLPKNKYFSDTKILFTNFN